MKSSKVWCVIVVACAFIGAVVGFAVGAAEGYSNFCSGRYVSLASLVVVTIAPTTYFAIVGAMLAGLVSIFPATIIAGVHYLWVGK